MKTRDRVVDFVIVGGVVTHYRGMHPMRTLYAATLSGIVLVANGGSASAQATPRLVYQAPAECPDQAAFVAAISERGSDVGAGPVDLTLRVVIEADADIFKGSLQTRRGDQTSLPREVHGTTCTEVADALAVISAIALAENQRPAAAAPAVTPADAAAAPVNRADEDRLRTAGDPFDSPFAATRRIEVAAGTLRFDRARSLTLSVGGAVGVLPGQVVPRVDLTSTFASFTTPPDGTSYMTSPVIRGRLSWFGPASHQSNDTTTTVFGLSSAIGTCGAPYYDTRGLVVLFCGELGFGVMQVNTDDRNGERVQNKLVGFGSVGLAVDAQYNLGSLVHLQLKLGVDSTTTPVSAERADGTEIFHSTAFGRSSTFSGYGVSGYGMIGIGIHF